MPECFEDGWRLEEKSRVMTHRHLWSPWIIDNSERDYPLAGLEISLISTFGSRGLRTLGVHTMHSAILQLHGN